MWIYGFWEHDRMLRPANTPAASFGANWHWFYTWGTLDWIEENLNFTLSKKSQPVQEIHQWCDVEKWYDWGKINKWCGLECLSLWRGSVMEEWDRISVSALFFFFSFLLPNPNAIYFITPFSHSKQYNNYNSLKPSPETFFFYYLIFVWTHVSQTCRMSREQIRATTSWCSIKTNTVTAGQWEQLKPESPTSCHHTNSAPPHSKNQNFPEHCIHKMSCLYKILIHKQYIVQHYIIMYH